ncbi:hypothetical protein CEXT_253481 [Caerostris extrusa]|uniref:Uncharacterized protein n=1 Tax=Caerostris extrusa TaxID=172846 RepID=A0AAV4N2V1_CAEEX|nr:hypothetical protein CEXT_253481 [Caerostris extrusa]
MSGRSQLALKLSSDGGANFMEKTALGSIYGGIANSSGVVCYWWDVLDWWEFIAHEDIKREYDFYVRDCLDACIVGIGIKLNPFWSILIDMTE